MAEQAWGFETRQTRRRPRRVRCLARRIGHVNYRSETELDERFGRQPQQGGDPVAGGRYAIDSYLDHQADKLARRFDANTYIVLNEAINHHDIRCGRGGVAAALRRLRVRLSCSPRRPQRSRGRRCSQDNAVAIDRTCSSAASR